MEAAPQTPAASQPAPAPAAPPAAPAAQAAPAQSAAPQTSADGEVNMAMLTEAERELADLIAKKRQLDKSLASIEASIYALEGSYLEETQYGNIVRGFEGYLSSRADRRKSRPTDSDRLFSQSSVTYLKAIEMRQREDMA